MPPRISDDDGRLALAACLTAHAAGSEPARRELLTAVRWTLGLLAEAHPGRSVEVRVPPAGAVQVIEGVRHVRGTPPNVVEMNPRTWLALAAGERDWTHAVGAGHVLASGTRADLADYLPLPQLVQER
nr:hypothetical protein [Actinomycetales bacterium]